MAYFRLWQPILWHHKIISSPTPTRVALKFVRGEIFFCSLPEINYLWAFFWNFGKKMSKSFSGQGSSKVQCQLCCSMFLMFIAIDHFSPCTMHLHIALRCIWIPLSFFLCALCSSKKCFMHDNETVPTSKKKCIPSICRNSRRLCTRGQLEKNRFFYLS